MSVASATAVAAFTPQLQQAHRMEAIGRLASGIAHDFNNLLTAISGYSELIAVRLSASDPMIDDVNEIRRADAGTGLGLATVHDIVTRNHGRIELMSAPGAGTTFAIELPATHETPSPDVRPARPADVVDGGTLTRASSSRVLVVEDDPGVRRLIELALGRAGHHVFAVASPRDALAALTSGPAFTLVLTDIIMPEMNGHDLAVEIRRLAPGLRIGFMSGFACDLARQTAGELFLAKPFTVESLTSFVRQASSAATVTP